MNIMEQELILMAYQAAGERIANGTASSQETTHFLKLASSKARIEKEKLELENELIKAKTESIQSSKRIEELYIDAINAMKRYSGHGDSDDEY